MSITVDSPVIYSNGRLVITCIVNLIQDVDTPVSVQMWWNASTEIYGNNRIMLREDMNRAFVYKSIMLIDPFMFSDAGVYTCIADVIPKSRVDLTVFGVSWAIEVTASNVCKCCGSS